MYSLYIKEIKSYLSSLLGYIFIAVFLVVTGLFLWVFPNINNIFYAGIADLESFFSLAKFLFLFLIPAITMRSFAEEKISKIWLTDQTVRCSTSLNFFFATLYMRYYRLLAYLSIPENRLEILI